MAEVSDAKWPVAGIFNLVFLALATAWMARGCREGLLRPTILGSLLLVGLTTARYFDLFESLAVRGLIFLLVGGLLFTEGILFRHARRRAQMLEEEEQGQSEKKMPVKLTDLDQDWSARFRLEYRPPQRALGTNVPNSKLIWHGRLPSRAFNAVGSFD